MSNPEQQKIYSGSFILTSYGIILIGWFIFSCVMIFRGSSSDNIKWLAGIPPFIVLFIAFSFETNYFILTDKKLIVRNPILFWRKKEFDLDMVKEITIDMPLRSAVRLNVKTDTKTKAFRACSLRNKTWKMLKEDFQRKNIIVNDKVNWGWG